MFSFHLRPSMNSSHISKSLVIEHPTWLWIWRKKTLIHSSFVLPNPFHEFPAGIIFLLWVFQSSKLNFQENTHEIIFTRQQNISRLNLFTIVSSHLSMHMLQLCIMQSLRLGTTTLEKVLTSLCILSGTYHGHFYLKSKLRAQSIFCTLK